MSTLQSKVKRSCFTSCFMLGLQLSISSHAIRVAQVSFCRSTLSFALCPGLSLCQTAAAEAKWATASHSGLGALKAQASHFISQNAPFPFSTAKLQQCPTQMCPHVFRIHLGSCRRASKPMASNRAKMLALSLAFLLSTRPSAAEAQPTASGAMRRRCICTQTPSAGTSAAAVRSTPKKMVSGTWFAVKELHLRYHNPKTTLLLYIPIMVT